MRLEQTEMQEEREYLQEVISFTEQRMEELQRKKELLKGEVEEQAEVMREELTQVIRDFDDVIQLSMENAALTCVQKQYADNEKEYCRLQKLKESPYFARIDFVDREFGEENTVYIGASGLSDTKSYQMYICDWRAPVCELFYGFDTGEAWYETAQGRVEVELYKKRQYKITGGQMEGMYDSDSSLYDEILEEVLSGQTETGLKVIVDSIQKEQNRAIRFTKAPHVLIYGPAGSGKTSVGMHRLAYILYAQKERLNSKDIVILSNNHIFTSYVTGILPQLCEEDVSHMVFHELLDSLLPREITCEDFYSQYRAVEEDCTAESKVQKRRERIALKYSLEMLQFIEGYFGEYSFDIPDLVYEGEIIISGEELNERMHRRLLERREKGIQETLKQRRDLLIDMVKKLYENYFLEHQEQICESIAESVNEEEEEKPEDKKVKIRYRRLCKYVISDTVETIRALNQVDTFTHFLEILQQFSEIKGTTEPMDRLAKNDWDYGELCFEDALLYAIIGCFTGEIKPFSKVLHVLIDELQDYNPLQLYLVRLLYPRSAFTMLADSSQAVSSVMSVQHFTMLEQIWNMVSDQPIEKLLLDKSYRSSAPINELAFRWLKQFDPACAGAYTYFKRDGKAPVIRNSKKPEKEVWELLKDLKHHHLVGIITASEADARALYESAGLENQSIAQSGESLQLITQPREEIHAGRVIMPLILTKGLEFDAVILYRCMDRLHDKESYARKMYLACTRALHELYLVDKDPLCFADILS